MFKDNILDIFKDCSFEDLTDQNFKELILENLPLDFNYDYCYGASKLVILPTHEDHYVIKIPFSGYIFEDNFDSVFCNFSGANWDSKRCWDYCFTELLMYHYAKREGINKVFAKIHLVGTVNKHPIYIQEKAVTYEARDDIEKKHLYTASLSEVCELCYERGYKIFNLEWITDAYNYYGDKQFHKIMIFISSIGDLHEANIGYIGSRPVLIDYSDFMS